MSALFTPSMPPQPPDDISGLRILSRLRHNGFAAFPARCFRESVISRRAAGKSLTLVTGPEAIRSVLLSDGDTFQRLRMGRRILGPIVGNGILVSEGNVWRERRRAMAPAFTPRAVSLLVPHICACCAAAMRGIDSDKPLDLFAVVQTLALDIAATTMFSMTSNSFGTTLRQMVSSYMRGLGRPRPTDFLLPAWLPTIVDWRRAKFRRRWLTLVETIVASRPSNVAERNSRDLFDLLVHAFGAEGSAPGPTVIDEAGTMMVAGHETTATALFWTMWLLARAPEWQAAIAEEVRYVDLSSGRAAASLDSLAVTKSVVQEALRLFPPAFMTGRESQAETTLGGRQVYRGGIVLVPIWMLHRRPDLWRDPSAFDPRRFLEGREPEKFSFLPFGAGPHVCIGAQLAMTEAILVVALFVQLYQISVQDTAPVLPVGVLSTRPSRTPLFRLSRRKERGLTPARADLRVMRDQREH